MNPILEYQLGEADVTQLKWPPRPLQVNCLLDFLAGTNILFATHDQYDTRTWECALYFQWCNNAGGNDVLETACVSIKNKEIKSLRRQGVESRRQVAAKGRFRI